MTVRDSESVLDRLDRMEREMAGGWKSMSVSRNHLRALMTAVRAAERAPLLTYDPSRTDAQNDELQRRAKALNDALRPLITPSEQNLQTESESRDSVPPCKGVEKK